MKKETYFYYLFSFHSSRNASTLNTSDLLALIIMAQNMYPSNGELDEPSPEVENTPTVAGAAPPGGDRRLVSDPVTVSFPACCATRMLRVHPVLVRRAFTPRSRPPQTRAAQVSCVSEFSPFLKSCDRVICIYVLQHHKV